MFLKANDALPEARSTELKDFQHALGFKFKQVKLLNQALTHRSCANEDQAKILHNERLEFLGDSVLGLVVAEYLYTKLPERSEGELARIKSFVVSEDVLAELAQNLLLDRYILIGKGEELSGGRRKKAILADAFEAIIGALYLDSGTESCQKFIMKYLAPEVDKVLQNKHRKDYKSILQEFSQKHLHEYPRYSLVKRSGPDHDRTFWTTCTINKIVYGPCQGKNKKEAEQSAAMLAYELILSQEGPAREALLATEAGHI